MKSRKSKNISKPDCRQRIFRRLLRYFELLLECAERRLWRNGKKQREEKSEREHPRVGQQFKYISHTV